MRLSFLILASLLLLLTSCKQQNPKETAAGEPERSIPEKIAYAHGIEHWNKVKELQFTFNVDRDTSHFERSWTWMPKSGEVHMQAGGDTLSYNRKAVDSVLAKADASFINDKYWLLAPFQLLWDRESYTYEHAPISEAPISGKPMQKLTIVYGNSGGYTPGDAYDFYFGDDYVVQEWVFRRANQPEPSATTTWEGYETTAGMKISKKHLNAEGKNGPYFSGISVRTD